MVIELVLVGLVGVIVSGGIIQSRRARVAALDFEGLLPADPTSTTRFFRHEGVECWVRRTELDAIEVGLVDVPNPEGTTLVGRSDRGVSFKWTSVEGADRFMSYAAAPELLTAAAFVSGEVSIYHPTDGALRIHARRPRIEHLPALCRALTLLSRELGLPPRLSEEGRYIPALDGANAPSGASVAAPGFGKER